MIVKSLQVLLLINFSVLRYISAIIIPLSIEYQHLVTAN